MSRAGQVSESEERFRLLAEHSSDVLLEAQLDTTITWASPSALDVMGWEPASLVGKQTAELVHPDCLAAFRDMATHAAQTGEETQITLLTRQGDGSYRWMEARGQQVPASERRPAFRVIRLRDVQQQVDAEKALTASEARLRTTLDTMLEPFVLLRAVRDDRKAVIDFVFEDANQSALDVYGMSRNQLLGASLLNLHHNAKSTGLFDMYVKVVDTGTPLILDNWSYPQEIREDRVLRYNVRAVRVGDAVSQVWWEVTAEYDAAQLRLQESEEQYRMLAENSRDVVVRTDQQQRIEWVSQSALGTMGWAPAALIGKVAKDLVHPSQLPIVNSTSADFASGRTELTLLVLQGDGTYRWMDVLSHMVAQNGKEFRVTRLIDVDARHRAEARLAASETRYRLLAENASDVVWNVNEQGCIDWASESSLALLGWDSAELIGTESLALVHADDLDRAKTSLAALALTGHSTCACRMHCKDGSWRWVVRNAHKPVGAVGSARVVTLRDINDEMRARQDLDRALGHDPLTGLPNRLTLMDQLTAMLREASDTSPVCVLMVGVDGVAAINEAYTYAAGDLILTTVAARLAELAPEHALLARGASADFILAVPGMADANAATLLSDQLRATMESGVQSGAVLLRPTLSIGITISRAGVSSAELLAEADTALRASKDAGHDRATVAGTDGPVRIRERLQIEESVRAALSEERIVQWYQPITDLSTREVVGYESLMRMVELDGRITMPNDFIPLLERSSLMCSLDLSAIAQSLGRLSMLPEGMFISVNVSAHTLADDQRCRDVLKLFEQAGPLAQRVHVELTETAILGGSGVLQAMRQIAATGAKWYLDDFGTGFSSISHLRDLPLAGLKLDVSFTRGIREGDETSRRLARALSGLAAGLGLDTVAEGVEFEPEAAVLHGQGWRHGQGWLFGHAAPLP